MHNYSGLVYRLWGVCGFLILIGAVVLLIPKNGKKLDNQAVWVGIVSILLGIGLGLRYISCIHKCEVQIYQGTFAQEYRNTRIAPPLPFTMEYEFHNNDGEIDVFYLDVFSKKEIYNEAFEVDTQYRIFFDEATRVIVRVEELNS